MLSISVKALEVIDLVKLYSNGVRAISSVNLSIEEGDFFALLGPNGAGKSTLIGIITSLVRRTDGTVRIFGHDLDRDWRSARLSLGSVPQEFNFNIFETVYRTVYFEARLYGLDRTTAQESTRYFLERLSLWEKRHIICRDLSGGMKRRLMIARALVHRPRLLLLDEPTTGVDVSLRRATWSFLQELNRQGMTILLTTHYLEEAESLCRGVALIDHGKISHKTTVKNLLKGIPFQKVCVQCDRSSFELPRLEGYQLHSLEEDRFEACYDSSLGLHPLFQALEAQGVRILSVTPSGNRLEEWLLERLSLDRSLES